MGIMDDVVLGVITDLDVNEYTQEEVNEESLFLFDQNNLLKSVKLRMSAYSLYYYFNVLKDSEDLYWKRFLREIISHYSINSLKPYLSEGYPTNMDLINQTKLMYYFIKISLIKTLEEHREYAVTSKENLEILIIENDLNPPKLFKIAMLGIDNESFDLFMKTILYERTKEYSEDI